MTTKSIKQRVRTFINKFILFVAVSLIVFVLLLSVIKLTLPYWLDNKEDITAYIEDSIGGEVDYDSLDVDWTRFNPVIRADNFRWVTVDESGVRKTAAKQIRIELGLWQSIYHGYLKTYDVSVSDVAIELTDALTDSSTSAAPEDKPVSLDEWLTRIKHNPQWFEHAAVRIQNVSIEVDTAAVKTKFEIPLLQYRKLRDQKQLIIEMNHQSMERARLVLEADGEIFADETQLNGYFAIDSFNAQKFDYRQGESDTRNTQLSAEYWIAIKGKNLQSGKLITNLNEVYLDGVEVDSEASLVTEQGQHEALENKDLNNQQVQQESRHLFNLELDIYRNNGELVIETQQQGTLYNELAQDDQPIFSITKNERQAQVAWDIRLQHLAFEPISKFLSPVLSKLSGIADLGLYGDIEQAQVTLIESEQGLELINGYALLSDVLLVNDGTFPELMLEQLIIEQQPASDSGVSDSVRIYAVTEQQNLKWANQLGAEWPLDALSLDLEILSHEQATQFRIEHLSIQSPQLNLTAAGSLYSLEGEAGIDSSLLLETERFSIPKVKPLLSTQLLSESLYDFIDESLPQAMVNKARLIIRGDMAQYPFAGSEGLLFTQIDVDNTLLNFDDEWPNIENIVASVSIENEQLAVKAHSLDVASNGVTNAYAVIPDLLVDDPELIVKSTQAVANSGFKKLFNTSPLREWLGETVGAINLNKPIDSRLQLDILLADDTQVATQGSIEFDGQKITQLPSDLVVDALFGTLHFNDDGAWSERLVATMMNHDISLTALFGQVDSAGAATRSTNDVDISGSFELDLVALGQFFDIPIPLSIQGTSQATAEFTVDTNGVETLIIRSNLVGTAIQGVQFLNKESDTASSLYFKLRSDDGDFVADMRLDKQILAQFAGNFERLDAIRGQILASDVVTKTLELPAKGIDIDMSLQSFDLDEWSIHWNSSTSDDEPWPISLNDVTVYIEQLRALEQDLGEFKAVTKEISGNVLELGLSAEQFSGGLRLLADGRKQVALDFLNIDLQFSNSAKVKEGQQPLLPTVIDADTISNMPLELKASNTGFDLSEEQVAGWQLECFSCVINGNDLGAITIITRAHSNGVTLQGDIIVGEHLTAFIEGDWLNGETELSLQFDSPDGGKLLDHLGYGSGLKNAILSGEMIMNWDGGFHDFTVGHLNGSGELWVDEGIITELSDREARIFSLFSLESIQRRLSLDFSDLFSEGFHFNDIRASFELNQGVLSSDNIFIDGTAADVKVSGVTDFNSFMVEQHVTVVPKISSSLPLIAGWALEPTTGILLYLINKIFEPAIDVVASIEYRITGPFSSPEVIEINKLSKEVTLPEAEPVESE